MKRIFTTLFISALTLPTLTVMGCAHHNSARTQEDYYCRQTMKHIYDAPHRYKPVGRNKRLATTKAMLQKDYRHYRCYRYEQGGKLK